MNKRIKSVIIGGLVGGIVYASVMAGFDYFQGLDFSVWKFIFGALVFGTFMGIVVRNKVKK